MTKPKVGKCLSVQDFMSQIEELIKRYNVTGVAIALENDDYITTHQFGMDDRALFILSKLYKRYSVKLNKIQNEVKH